MMSPRSAAAPLHVLRSVSNVSGVFKASSVGPATSEVDVSRNTTQACLIVTMPSNVPVQLHSLIPTRVLDRETPKEGQTDEASVPCIQSDIAGGTTCALPITWASSTA